CSACASLLTRHSFPTRRSSDLFLGPMGSFTHQAAESRFGAMSEYLSFGSIKSVFQAVDTGKTRFGVVPIENNQEGIVSETLDVLDKLDLKIVAEDPMSIHFSLSSTSIAYMKVM